jgi:putative tryptophan/tyrosine transport system substrate-binding protein
MSGARAQRELGRRRFMQGVGMAGLALLAGCGRLPWQAQPAPKVYRVGYLSAQGLAIDAPRLEALQRGLRELGSIEGQNLTIERRLAEGQLERLPALAAELAQLQLDVIVTFGEPAVKAMQNATSTIPIVFAAHGDPIGTGLAVSFAHPGGNITGVSEMAPELAGKRLELLKQAVPTVMRVGAIYNAGEQAMAREYGEALVGAETVGIELQNLSVRTPDDLEQAYQAAVEGRLDGIVVIVDGLIARNRDRLVELSTKSGLPTISGDSRFAAAGGLMSYGPNLTRQTQRAAYYVDRILKGAKPANLPIEQPMYFDFVINARTAQALGLTIPQHVLLQATEIIQ